MGKVGHDHLTCIVIEVHRDGMYFSNVLIVFRTRDLPVSRVLVLLMSFLYGVVDNIVTYEVYVRE